MKYKVTMTLEVDMGKEKEEAETVKAMVSTATMLSLSDYVPKFFKNVQFKSGKAEKLKQKRNYKGKGKGKGGGQ